jgi:two-component system, NarL family, sensor kinase
MTLLLVGFLALLPTVLPTQPDSLEQKIAMATGLERAARISDAVYMYSRTDLERSRHFVRLSSDFSNQNPGDVDIEAFALLNNGVWLSYTGSLDSAIYYLEAAHKKQPSNTALAIKILAALGKTYISAAYAEKGLVSLFEALELLKQAPHSVDEMKIRSNIMWAYLELKRYADCISYGRTVLQTKRNSQNEWIIPYLTNNMAASYVALNKPDSARYFVELGIPIAEANQDNGLIANGYFILGNLYSGLGQYELALSQFEKAQPYRERTGNIFYQVADLYVLADMYYKTGDYHQGLEAGLRGLKLAEENKLTLKFEGVYQVLGKNYEALGDYKNAARYFQLLATVKDSVYQKASANALAEMETRYETEKKEMQLAEQELALQQNNRLILFLAIVVILILIIVLIGRRQSLLKGKERMMRREKELQEELTRSVISSQEAERTRFAKDLHDGLGQLISSVRLFINQSNEDWVSQANQLLDTMHKEIRNLAFALQPYTLTTEGITAALHELALRINSTGKISIRISASEQAVRVASEIEVSVYRVAQEWLNNIIKYANASEVHINLNYEEVELTLAIEDNGHGFDPVVLQSSSGHGWKNIRSRIQACRGSVSIESGPETNGSILLVTIPIAALHLKVA